MARRKCCKESPSSCLPERREYGDCRVSSDGCSCGPDCQVGEPGEGNNDGWCCSLPFEHEGDVHVPYFGIKDHDGYFWTTDNLVARAS